MMNVRLDICNKMTMQGFLKQKRHGKKKKTNKSRSKTTELSVKVRSGQKKIKNPGGHI